MIRVRYHNRNGRGEEKIYEFATVSNAKEFIEAHGGDSPWPDGKVFISASDNNAYFEVI